MKHTRRPRTSWKEEKSTLPSILSSMVPMKPMTGQTQKSGRKPIPLLEPRSVSIKSKLPANLQNRIPVMRIPLDS